MVFLIVINNIVQEAMPNDEEPGDRATPVLRLRPTVPTELIQHRQRVKQPDGPWIAHPDLVSDWRNQPDWTVKYAPDITMGEYRDLWKESLPGAIEELRSVYIEDFHIESIVHVWHSIKVQRIGGKTDHEVASAIERHYVGAHQYGSPFNACLGSHHCLTFTSCNIGICVQDFSRLLCLSTASETIGE